MKTSREKPQQEFKRAPVVKQILRDTPAQIFKKVPPVIIFKEVRPWL